MIEIKLGTLGATKWLTDTIKSLRRCFLVECVRNWSVRGKTAALVAERDKAQDVACGKGLVMMARIVKTNTHQVFLFIWNKWKSVAKVSRHVKQVSLKVMLFGIQAGNAQRKHTGALYGFTVWKSSIVNAVKHRAQNIVLNAEREVETEKKHFAYLARERVFDYGQLLEDVSRLQTWFHSSLKQVSDDQANLMKQLVRGGTEIETVKDHFTSEKQIFVDALAEAGQSFKTD